MRLIPLALSALNKIENLLLEKAYCRNTPRRTFIEKNNKFWESMGSHNNSSNKYVLSEGVTGNSFWAMLLSTTNAILASAYKAKTIYLFESIPASYLYEKFVQDSFGSNIFLSVDEMTKPMIGEISEKAQAIFDSLEDPKDILSIRYRGTLIGSCIYDSYLKYRYATIHFLDEDIIPYIVNAIKFIEATNQIKEKYDIVAGYFTHLTGVYNGAPLRFLINNQVPIYSSVGGLGNIVKYKEFEHSCGDLYYPICIPMDLFERISKHFGNDHLLEKADIYISDRSKGHIKDYDAIQAYLPDKKIYTSKEEFCDKFNLDHEKPTVFVMLHAMNDDPHYLIQNCYVDFYEWFMDTLEHAKKLESYNWVFKQHPSLKNYTEDSNVRGIMNTIDRKHIIYFDENHSFNSSSIQYLADVILTSGGTSALEYSCWGIPSIVTCENVYSGYEIVNIAKTKEEYHQLLSTIGNLEKLSEDVMSKAKILFYLAMGVAYAGLHEGILKSRNWEEAGRTNSDEVLHEYIEFHNEQDPESRTRVQNMIAHITEDKYSKEPRDMYLDFSII